MIAGALLIVGATVMFLRDLAIPSSGMSAVAVFVAGVGLVLVAFRPQRTDFAAREEEPAEATQTTPAVDSSYDRAALARLQEAFHADAKQSDRTLG